MMFGTDYGVFKDDPNVDLGNLKAKIGRLPLLSSKGQYAIFLPDRRGGVRLAMYHKTPLRQRNFVRPSYPIHGVNILLDDLSNHGDSFEGLERILQEGFRGEKGHANVTVHAQETDVYFAALARNERKLLFARPSEIESKKGDRYLVECKRFVMDQGVVDSPPHQIRSASQYAIEYAETQNLRANVLVAATVDESEWDSRVSHYEEFFDEHGVERRYFDNLGNIVVGGKANG